MENKLTAEDSGIVTVESAEEYLKLGEQAMSEENNLEEAQKYFTRALELTPDNADALNNLGVVFWSKDELENSLTFINKAYNLEKNNPLYTGNLFDILVSLNQKEKAMEILSRYLKYNPDDDYFHLKYYEFTGKVWEHEENIQRSNLIYWKKMQDEGYFENHMYYGHGTDNLPLYGDDANLISKFVQLTKDMNVAVIGCGYGRESVIIGPHVKHIYGIDVNKKILDKAVRFVNERGVSNFTPVLAESWQEDITEKIDLVFELTVFQHLTRDLTRDYIRGMAQKLSENGRMLLQFMDCEYGTKEAELIEYEPCVNWKLNDIEELAKENNLQIIKVDHQHWPQDKAYWHWVLLGRNI